MNRIKVLVASRAGGQFRLRTLLGRAIILALLPAILFGIALCNQSDSNNDLAMLALIAAEPAVADLPEPALGAAKLQVAGGDVMDATVGNCKEVDLFFTATGTGAITLHFLDFGANGSITVGKNNAGAIKLNYDELDANGGTWQPGIDCSLQVKTNTATIIEYQMLNCPLVPEAGLTEGTNSEVSFRVKCTKG